MNVRAMKYGSRTENIAFECYRQKRNPLIKKCGLVVHPIESWIAGSPDGVDPLTGTLLEIKCPVGGEATLEQILQAQNVKRYLKFNEVCQSYELNCKHEYYCQVQVNLWIMNCTICDFVVYSLQDNDFVIVEVPYDANYVTKVINKLKKLYFEKMLTTIIK